MTKLNELINELCPNGVEYRTLGEVTEMQRGTSLTRINSNLGEYPVISGGRDPAFYCDKFNRENETITVAGSGAGAGYVQYWNQKIFVCDAFSIKGNKNLLTKYIYYCLENLQEEIYATKKGGGVPHVHISSISNFKIPVPPLPVQEEIVRILDKFTSLEAELEAELEARRVQYEYYRDELLTAKTHKTEEVFLEDIAEYSKEKILASEVSADSYVGVDNLLQNRQGKEASTHIPKEGNLTKYYPKDILIGNIRPYLKKIWFADSMGGTNGDVLVIHATSKKIIPRYLYFNLSSDRFFDYDNSKSKGAKMPRGDKDIIMKYKLTLPSLEVQKRIVNVLDNFDAICSDLKIGLPAEIEARKKQYEYYRDLLLTFAERGNTILTEQNRTEQNR